MKVDKKKNDAASKISDGKKKEAGPKKSEGKNKEVASKSSDGNKREHAPKNSDGKEKEAAPKRSDEKKKEAASKRSGKKKETAPKRSDKKKKEAAHWRLPVEHLLPFVLAVIISFVWFLPYKPAVATMSIAKMILKCLPILYLAIYLRIVDKGRGESGNVFYALIFSAIGDGFLAFHDICFIYGLAAFAMAHSLYIITFGFKNARMILGGALFTVNFLILSYLTLPKITQVPYKIAMPIYSLFLVTMAWRALDRYSCLKNPKNDQRRLCSAMGGSIFVVSDSCYVFLQMFELVPHIPAQVVILSTYYLSQVLLMLGSCDYFWGPDKKHR